jgi:hypothetical protein
MDDVWEVIWLLQEEVRESNANGTNFDEDKSIIAQLPFFTCTNHFYTKEISRDVERYTYCVNSGTPPFPGSYGEQPAKWVRRFIAIKNAFAKKEGMMISKAKQKAKAKNVK